MVACRLHCIIRTPEKEGMKETVRASNGEVYLQIRVHTGVLPSSETMGGGCQDRGFDPFQRRGDAPRLSVNEAIHSWLCSCGVDKNGRRDDSVKSFDA